MSRMGWTLGLLLLAFGGHVLAQSTDSDGFLTGLRPASAAEQALIDKHAITLSGLVHARSPLPSRVSNTEFLPRVARQSLPNCGAFAPTYYLKTYLEARKRGWGQVSWLDSDQAVSPGIGYVFGLSGAHPDGGASIGGTISLMNKIGSLPLSRLPDSDRFDRSTFPPLRFFLEAMPYRGGDTITFETVEGRLSEGGLLALKEWLAAGEIAVFGIDISDATFDYGRADDLPGVDNNVIHALGGSALSLGHAFTVIGYDDDKPYVDADGQSRQGAFLVVNSWGTNWGVVEAEVGTAGFAWFAYDYFRASAWSVMSMTLPDDPPPELVAVFTKKHANAEALSSAFWGGGLADPDWENVLSVLAPSSLTAYDPAYPLAVNVTSPDGEPSHGYWWRIFDVNWFTSSQRGTAEVFRIYRYQDLLDQLPNRLYSQQGGGGSLVWERTALADLDAIYLDGAGLPAVAGPANNTTLVHVGLMGTGEAVIETPSAWGSVIFADLNGNGRPDLISLGEPTEVYENLGGTFQRVQGHGLPDVGRAAAAAGDFDRDGLPDLAVVGAISVFEPIARVYRNMGNFRFEDAGAGLPGVSGSDLGMWPSAAWGDFDNDGLEDLAVWGFTDSVRSVRVFRNLGNGRFEPVAFEPPERVGGVLAWLDVNGNGWLDLTAGPYVFYNRQGVLASSPAVGTDVPVQDDLWDIQSGIWADFTGNGLPDLVRLESVLYTNRYQARLIHNLGEEVFRDSGITLANVRYARMAAGDYSNNGRLDLASTHVTTDGYEIGPMTSRSTMIYRQTADGRFRDAGFDMEGVTDGDIAFSDVDGDGALDILAVGELRTFDGSRPVSARLYRSRLADAPILAQPNTPPTAPAGLQVAHDPTSSLTTFSWDHGTDAQTPRAALAYNVRVGTLPGLGDIYSAASSAPITPNVRSYRIAPDQPGLLLRGLQPGFYYWSVRTVDSGWMVSEWTAPELLVIDGFDPRDVNRDGQFDVADLVKFADLLESHRALIPLEFDFNQDGVINQADLRALSRRLTGATGDIPGSYPVSSAGATIEQDGLSILIPAGTLAPGESTEIQVERVDARPDFGGNDGADAYLIDGLPVVSGQPIEILIDPVEQFEGLPLVFIGEEVLARGSTERSIRQRPMVPVRLPDGRLRVVVPALPQEAGLDAELDRAGRSQEDRYRLNIGVLGGYASLTNARFAIHFPMVHVGDDVENVMSALEAAYQTLRDTHGFSYAARTRWPMEVFIRDLGTNEDGAMISSVWGDNHGTIEINSRILEDRDKTRATAAHEFFHAVQGFYDPRSRTAKAWRMSRHYWLDEAMSTWVESLVVANPAAYVPATYFQNAAAPFLGVATGIHGATAGVVQEYGYGMAPLIKYLVSREGGAGIPVRIYQAIRAGRDSVAALNDAVPDTPLLAWYGLFFENLLEERIYPLGFGALTALVESNRRLILDPLRPSSVLHVPVKTRDLSAVLHLAGFAATYPHPEPDSIFLVRYDGDPTHGLRLFRARNQELPVHLESLADFTPVKFAVVDNALAFRQNDRRLLALVTDTMTAAPHTTEREGVLTMGLARQGPLEVPEYTATPRNVDNRPFPAITARGEIDTVGISDFNTWTNDLWTYGVGGLWGAETVDLKISYQAEVSGPTTMTYQDSLNREVTLSTTDIQTYRLYLTVGDDPLTAPTQQFDSTTGHFDLSIDLAGRSHGEIVRIAILASYTLTRSVSGGSTDVFEIEWPLALLGHTLP